MLLSAPCVVGGRMPPSAAAVAGVALLGSLLTSSGFVRAPPLASRGQVGSITGANLPLDDTICIRYQYEVTYSACTCTSTEFKYS